jgi:Oxidoreductase family, NAD-binding Rossmann fold
MTIRIGLIGAGIMGADHARIFTEEVPGTTLQVICDADQARAKSVADATGATHIASDPLAVINDASVDAVVIAAPDQFHASLTLACIAAGKPVLCEKPLSQSTTECLAVLDAEEKRGRRLVQVGFMRRFDPSYTEIKSPPPMISARKWRSAIQPRMSSMWRAGCWIRISLLSACSVLPAAAKPPPYSWCSKPSQANW